MTRPTPLNPATAARLAKQRQRETQSEEFVARQLRKQGFRYRRNVKSLPGSPDFANVTRKWAIFVNGCFWHNHTNCRRASIPRNNQQFWLGKFEANRARDAQAIRELRRRGFLVRIVWECELSSTGHSLSKIFEPSRIQT